jgi:hypothetical protein
MIKVRIKKLPQARTGYQVQGALVNDVPAMGGRDYNAYIGKQKLKESKYITAVPRDKANLEAEGGETVYGDINGDGMPEHKIIKGPRHHSGGVPLNLPEDTFIFSDTRGMMIKDPEVLAMFGKAGNKKGYTPAELAKQYDVQKYRKILEDPDTNAIERKTAELMIKKFVIKLGCLALVQESMKGFPQGIPAVAKPCMEAKGLSEQDVLPNQELNSLNEQLKSQMKKGESTGEDQVAEAEELNEGRPVAQAQEQAPQEMMPSPEEMMMYGGNYRRLRRAEQGMAQPSEEEMMMMQQQAQEAPQQEGGGDQMQQIMQQVSQALQQGAKPEEVIAQLLQGQIPPEGIMQIFVQLGMPEEQVGGLIQSVMGQLQGGQEQMQQEPQQEPPMSQEEMMRYGGMRRLKRAQEGMQQPSPEEMAMMQQQEQGGGDEIMEVIQEVQAALQRGADPSEVVMNLLENQIPPQTIVEIFSQLGADPQQVAALIQQVMGQGQAGGQEEMMAQQGQPMSEEEAMMMQQQQQAPPMAMYGMSMGGYDMPFFDIPQAEYGMAMGANPNNYQGRPKRIPGSGPMFPLPKADNGIVVDASNMDDAQLERAIWNAQQKALSDWKSKNPGKDPKKDYKEPEIQVKRKGTDGKIKTSKLKSSGFIIPEGKDITDLQGFPDTPKGRTVAAQYLLIEKNLNDPKVKAEIIKNTKEVIENHKSWTGKGGTDDPNKTWSKKYGALPSDEEIVKQALNHQKRNLMFVANDIDPQLFNDIGSGLNDANTVVNEGYLKPDGKPYTLQEAKDAIQKLKDAGYTDVATASKKLGVELDPKGKDRVLQQATMHSYAKSYQDFSSGKYDSDTDAKYAMDNFLGNVSLVHAGANDETSMGALYGPIGNKISPLDDTYDYDNRTWYGGSRGTYTTYGNTTLGHRYMVGKRNYQFEDVPSVGACQCETEKLPNGDPDPSYKPKDAKGNCTCQPAAKQCPCKRSTGTVMLTPDPNTGECPSCEEDVDVNVPGEPAMPWLQDIIKTSAAFGRMYKTPVFQPRLPGIELGTPRPTYIDDQYAISQIRGAGKTQAQGLGQFMTPQQFGSVSSKLQGDIADKAAQLHSQYDTANAATSNQFELKGTDIRNQESTMKTAAASKFDDQGTILGQQRFNTKTALGKDFERSGLDLLTSMMKTDSLNQMFPNYKVRPLWAGKMQYNPTQRQFNPQASESDDYFAQRQKCVDAGATNPDECARNVVNSKSKVSRPSTTADGSMVKTMYPSRNGGPVYEDGGYVYLDSWLPFLM